MLLGRRTVQHAGLVVDAEADGESEGTATPGDLDTREVLVRQRPPGEGPKVGEVPTQRPKAAVELPVDPPPQGWRRLLIRNKYGVDRDLAVVDESREQVLYLASGFWLRSLGEVREQHRDGATLYELTGRFANVPRRMDVRDARQKRVASVRAKQVHPLGSEIVVRLADGTEWHSEGSLAERQYAVTAHGEPLFRVERRSVQIRDSYRVDVAGEVDAALAIAVVWAIDEVLGDTI
jgi:uncharacterized protein YxjI